MKKKLLSACLVLGIAYFIGISAKHYSERNCNDLVLTDNVEALTNACDINIKKCGTKAVYINDIFTCPICKGKTGMMGTQYSYKKEGFDINYKEGFEGVRYSCTPYPETKTDINDVKEHSCK